MPHTSILIDKYTCVVVCESKHDDANVIVSFFGIVFDMPHRSL